MSNRKDYVLTNLIYEMENFPDYPILFLLERNQTFDYYYYKNNKNIINISLLPTNKNFMISGISGFPF